jgi:hypothetical protein
LANPLKFLAIVPHSIPHPVYKRPNASNDPWEPEFYLV